MSRFLWILLVAACASSPSSQLESADAGEACDAGVGPLGSCLPVRGACDECATSADCPNGQSCSTFERCRLCATTSGERACTVSTCLGPNDCCQGSCQMKDDAPPCGGACMRPDDECDDTRPCADGFHCEEVEVRCTCGGPSRACRPVCPGQPCGQGEACHGGRCSPSRCDTDGFDCADDGLGHVCDPARGDAHGCARKACETQSDCSIGLCVRGACVPGFGFCQLPLP